MDKVRFVMKNTKSQKVKGSVMVDEFVVGEKNVIKKAEVTAERNVKRVYLEKIDDFSSDSLYKSN